MICQGKKRIEWQERLSQRLLNIPYAHITFTLPREINHLARVNQKVVYNILMRSAWLTIKTVCADTDNVGALPGMMLPIRFAVPSFRCHLGHRLCIAKISQSYTWGSDLKYHIHVHTIVTFGGLGTDLKWHFPKRRNKVAGFRELCRTFKETFLEQLKAAYSDGEISYHLNYDQVEALVKSVRWVVNHKRPTTNTFTIENYLAKYICRSAVTPKRINYDTDSNIVKLLYNDYKNQKEGQAAPKLYRRMNPLDAIHAIVQHKLPPYFQRSRYYGLHSSAKYKSIKEKIDPQLKRDPVLIKLMFSIMKQLLNIPSEEMERKCSNCNSINLERSELKKDLLWPALHIRFYNINRGPPKMNPSKTVSI